METTESYREQRSTLALPVQSKLSMRMGSAWIYLLVYTTCLWGQLFTGHYQTGVQFANGQVKLAQRYGMSPSL